MHERRAAAAYSAADDLWILTAYFNPLRYVSRARNYTHFRDRIVESGLRLLTVECAFDGRPFELVPSDDVLQVRAVDVLWQKERLLNLALQRLPEGCSKLAWLDSDVLFENGDWARETSRLLEIYTLVQPFEEVIRLPRGCHSYHGRGKIWQGFAAAYARDPDGARSGTWAQHGETGYAWAARREVLSSGLYDACIVGGGDHAMSHAWSGGFDSPCLDAILGRGTTHRKHFERWARAVWGRSRGRVGVVSGGVLHLWHGDVERRDYQERHRALAGFRLDPDRDLRIGAEGCWEWGSRRPALHASVAHYFAARAEDG